jgi:peptidoglycan-associated lipoprotein
MKLNALAVVSALFLLAACGDSAMDGGTAGGAGGKSGLYGSSTVGNLGDESLNIGDRVFYDYDSSVLTSEAQSTLQAQAGWLRDNDDVRIVVEGHCDERGTREYNIALGERRAAAAKRYLVSMGVDASRISTISYGKERPAVLGHNKSAWSQNRRAVTVIAN